jgi:tetratricopeptide (TPR) repeat protein
MDNHPEPKQADAAQATLRRASSAVLGAVCLLVIGVYAGVTHLEDWEAFSANAASSCYNLLVQGFRAGHLSLRKAVPPGLAQLADPYDPVANRPYRLGPDRVHDLSYYKGRFYLYFGVTPALLLFWPFVVVTGRYLFHGQAVAIFCAAGYLASVGLLRALWRRYFPQVNVWVVAACAVALGLATTVPLMLPRSAYNEVAVSCAYMLTMLTLGALWRALHEPDRRGSWLGIASLAYGLAVGARPSLLLGAVILLVPVAQARHEQRRVWALLIAAAGPIALIGLGLMLYNAGRFGSPFEFGDHYQLAGIRSVERHYFHLRYFWFDFRAYFLAPAQWTARFPFVHKVGMPPLPAGYDQVETPFGILTNIPLVWLALAAPLAWRRRSGEATSLLRWFVVAVALLFVASAAPLVFYDSVVLRYEVDFTPALLLLGVVGLLGLERVTGESGLQRQATRWVWGGLLAFSVAFNLLACIGRCGEAHFNLGNVLFHAGRVPEAIQQYERASRLRPDDAGTYYNLGLAFAEEGKLTEAIQEYERALQIKADAATHNNLGIALMKVGRTPEAIEQYEQALRIGPEDAGIHYNLAVALMKSGAMAAAIEQYQHALRLRPDDADLHRDFAAVLLQAGKLPEAIEQYKQALQVRPDDAELRNNLGVALAATGRFSEAIEQYEQALRIKPDDAEAHNNLGTVLAGLGRENEAIRHWEEALKLKPEDARVHCNLGTALERTGRTPEATEQYQQALKLQPGLAAAKEALERLQNHQ